MAASLRTSPWGARDTLAEPVSAAFADPLPDARWRERKLARLDAERAEGAGERVGEDAAHGDDAAQALEAVVRYEFEQGMIRKQPAIEDLFFPPSLQQIQQYL
jgi:hypothetical protein